MNPKKGVEFGKFENCLKAGGLQKFDATKAMIEKELAGAAYDLQKARRAFEELDFKWATIKAYYAIFHAAKALVYSKGYREKTHYCLWIAFKTLFVDQGLVEEDYSRMFDETMDLREDADYGLSFSKGGAEEAIANAEAFLAKAKSLLT